MRRRRRTINKMRGGGKGDMIELTPDELLEIKADSSLHPEIIKNIKERMRMGIEHDPESKTFIIHTIPKSDSTLFISNRSFPDRYNKLLKIYNSGRTVITDSHTATNPHTILNEGEHTHYRDQEVRSDVVYI
jgi:hypothetical protein